MIKHYLVVVFLSFIMIAAMAYGIYSVGTPSQIRNQKLDQRRVEDLKNLTSQLENYYSTNSKLPENLSKVISTGSGYPLSIKDPETNQEYEYEIISPTIYNLCAVFKTSNKGDEKGSEINYLDKEFDHPEGRFCLKREIPVTMQKFKIDKTQSSQMYDSNLISFEDPNILSVVSDAKSLLISDEVKYPHGLFSEKNDGVNFFNQNDDEIRIEISFKKPVKIKSIAVEFAKCPDQECYQWTANGVNQNGWIQKPLVAGNQVKGETMIIQPSFDPETEFAQLDFYAFGTVATKDKPNKNIMIKKIKIGYGS